VQWDLSVVVDCRCSYDENPRLIFLHAEKQVSDPPISIADANDGTVCIVLEQAVSYCCSFI
jgi:hypothetical protein